MNNYDYKVNLYERMDVTVVAENEQEADRILRETIENITVKEIRDKLCKNLSVEIKNSRVDEQVVLKNGKDRSDERWMK